MIYLNPLRLLQLTALLLFASLVGCSSCTELSFEDAGGDVPADVALLDAPSPDVNAVQDVDAADAGVPDALVIDVLRADVETRPDVAPSQCGDGVVSGDEVCDDGVNNSRYGSCVADCTSYAPRCGDGLIQGLQGEVCDDGINDARYGGCDACSSLPPRCGDGQIDEDFGEVCDDGRNDGDYGSCFTDCTARLAYCGDGVVDEAFGEVCDDGRNDDLGGGCRPGCQEQDRSDELFSRDLIQIDINIEDDDWQSLLGEYKSRHSIFYGPDCRTRQVENPYHYYAADVTIDGVTVPQTGLRKRGHLGSGSNVKPSLKIKFDEFVDGQRFETMKRFAINNSKSDPGFMRACFTYESMRQAGIPAPRCTYANVSLNGENLGIYVAVEEVKKPFLRRHFASDEGNLYEGTACDWRPEFFGGFEQETNLDTDPSSSDLQAVFDAVEMPDEQLEAALDEVINLDAFYRFWAMESLIWHRDGYAGNANNYFIYADPTDGGRFHFLPWGPDSTFRPGGINNYPDSVLARGRIAFRLYQRLPSRARYYDELNFVRTMLWDSDALLDETDRVEALLRPYLREVDTGYDAGLAEMREFLETRNTVIDSAIAAGFPEWTAGMRTLPCRVPAGEITATFDTTYNSISIARGQGLADVQFTLEGEAIVFTDYAARFRSIDATREQLQIVGYTADNFRWVFTTNIRKNDPFFTPTLQVGTQPFLSPPYGTSAIERDLTEAVNLRRADFGEGTFTLDDYEATDGARIRGSFSAGVYVSAPPAAQE